MKSPRFEELYAMLKASILSLLLIWASSSSASMCKSLLSTAMTRDMAHSILIRRSVKHYQNASVSNGPLTTQSATEIAISRIFIRGARGLPINEEWMQKSIDPLIIVGSGGIQAELDEVRDRINYLQKNLPPGATSILSNPPAIDKAASIIKFRKAQKLAISEEWMLDVLDPIIILGFEGIRIELDEVRDRINYLQKNLPPGATSILSNPPAIDKAALAIKIRKTQGLEIDEQWMLDTIDTIIILGLDF